ncbi:MAG TPA: PQQ-binding-like beta-propeller repeat protein, partial [Gemmataceae bacterium]|nr:PQQ-binding-like beta-propeller repeat protein [Gemmataceae bacterium]
PPGFGQHVWGVFSMSGTRVALTDAFGRLEVSDTRGGKAKMLREAGPAIAALRWASNDTRLIAFHYDLFCTTWDPATGKVVASFQAQGPAIVGEDRWTAGVSIHPAGASVVVSDQLGTLACYDTASGKVNWQTRFARSRVVHTPDGRHFLVQDRSDPGTRARLYDAATGAPVRELPFRITAKTGMDAPFVYSPDGKYLVTADAVDFMIRFLEPDTGKVVHAFRAPRRSAAEAFAVSPDGSTVAVGCENGLLRTYAVATGQLLSERPAHRSMVTAVRYSSDGRSILTCSDDLTALLWDATPAPSPKR